MTRTGIVARLLSITAATLALLSSLQSPAFADLPQLQKEGSSDFITALQRENHGRGLPTAMDINRFTAYRYVDRNFVVVGVARSISIDQNGHMVIVPEKGSTLHGRPNPSHRELSHVLLENSAVIPQSLRKR